MAALNSPVFSCRTIGTACSLLAVLLLFGGCTKEGPVGPAGPTNENLTDPAIQPRIIATVPTNGSVGPFDQLHRPGEYYYYYPGRPHIVLQFNKLMYAPPNTIYRPWFGPVYMPYFAMFSGGPFTNIVNMTLYDSSTGGTLNYRVGQTYTVKIDSGMKDVNGNSTAEQYTFSYTPEPYFRIISFNPPDGTLLNPGDQNNLTITFNSPVGRSIRSSVHILPAIAGTWSTSSDSLFLTYVTSGRLPFGASYTISVDPAARDAYNNKIIKGYQSSYTVKGFGVQDMNPSDGSTNVDPVYPIYCDFNGTIDTASARTAFTIQPQTAGNLIIGTYSLEFVPLAGLDPNTPYVVTLSTALKASDSTHLAAPYITHFRTSKFKVSNTYPSDGQTGVIRHVEIQIVLNCLPDTASLRRAFSISPPAQFLTSIESNSLLLYPVTQLLSDTTYTVTLSTAARALNGDTLADPCIFSFTTGMSSAKK